ncbi:GntR family transcriptional regulator [Streptomyces carpaticus]|uniref:GntR family transcriptional regulator n=1 Tax=Streptomyces carpaticus TaxID=285558 RepID=UPI0031FA0FCD
MRSLYRYEVVANDFRQQITRGDLHAGAKLPTEEQLATQYGVGRPTIRQALGVLQAEELVEKRHGRGNFVRIPLNRIVYANNRTHHEPAPAGPPILTQTTIRETLAGTDLAPLLDVPEGTRLIEQTTISRRKGSTPHALVRSYLPRNLIPGPLPNPEPHTSPWADNLRTHLTTAGIHPTHTTERLTARPPTAEESETLNLAPGISVLAIQRQTHDTTNRIVEAAHLILSGDRVEATYTAPVTKQL